MSESLDQLLEKVSINNLSKDKFDKTYCGMVAIVGRPNVGKSSLLNNLIGQKVSITSKKPQTTRHRILGIYTEENYQIVFIDTPGLHIEETRAINKLMNRAASSSISEVSLVIFVVDAMKWTADDEMVLRKIKKSNCPTILAINKVDLIENKDLLFPFLEMMQTKHDFKEIIPISALKGINVDKLLSISKNDLQESDFFFPEDYITDRSQKFMASEILREKLFRFLGEELPYDITVEIEQFKQLDNGTFHINALILVQRQGQKEMVIGKNGARIKTIATQTRLDMEELFERKVFLEVWVKVKSGWADDERALRSLGYD